MERRLPNQVLNEFVGWVQLFAEIVDDNLIEAILELREPLEELCIVKKVELLLNHGPDQERRVS